MLAIDAVQQARCRSPNLMMTRGPLLMASSVYAKHRVRRVVCHGRYVAFQMASVAIPRQMFQEILRLIAELRPHHHQRQS
jgi:hypothetical protein